MPKSSILVLAQRDGGRTHIEYTGPPAAARTARTMPLPALVVCTAALQAAFEPVEFTSNGGQLLANGSPFSLKGAIWRGAEGPGDLPEGLSGVHAHSIEHYMEALSAGTFNAVRITFNHQAVLDAQYVEHFDPQVEPSLLGKRYLQALQLIIEEAARHGLLVALAAARLAPHESPGNGLWHSSAMPESAVMRSWTKITNVLCSQPNLFAVDLFDAPHGAAWGVGGANMDWHAAAQRLGNNVLSGCPRLLVMVQGARAVPWVGQDAPELPPGLNLIGVQHAAVRLTNQAKLVYTPALAPPSEHMLPAYREKEFPSNLPLVWGRQFGFIPELTGAALVLSRAGGLLDDMLDKSWQDALFQWAHEKNVGFFYDCMNPNPTNGGLLHKDWSTLRAMKLLLLNGLTGTKLSSLAPAPSILPGRFHPLSDVEQPESPPLSELACIDHIRATDLRGALDWQSGGMSSGTLLSIFTGPDSGGAWGSRLFEVLASARDHSVQHTPGGDRMQLVLNGTRCFPAPAGGDSGTTLCFQITDLTQYGGHVRFVNRGCGLLQRDAKRQTVALNDGAHLTLDVTFSPLGDDAPPSLLVSFGMPLVILALVGAAWLAKRVCISGNNGMRESCAIGCAKLLRDAGFTALAAEISQDEMNDHAPVSRSELRGSRKARQRLGDLDSRTVEMIPGMLEEEGLASPVHEIELDESIANQEEAVKRAMQLISANESSEGPSATPKAPVQVPTLAPPPSETPNLAADNGAGSQEVQREDGLIANIDAILSQQHASAESTSEAGGPAFNAAD